MTAMLNQFVFIVPTEFPQNQNEGYCARTVGSYLVIILLNSSIMSPIYRDNSRMPERNSFRSSTAYDIGHVWTN